MRFGVLGPLAVWTDHGEPVTIPGRKVRTLLADLLVNEGRPVSVDRLVDDLWGGSAPADPVAALHVRVSQLRRALANAEPGGGQLVVSQAPGYALPTAPDSVDAGRFATLIRRAQDAGDPRRRAGLLAEALGLWRGRALADFADDEFAVTAVARWDEQRLAAVEAYAEARLELGGHRELVAELGEQVSRHPYRERLRAAYMRALHRAGRSSEALESFQELRRQLVDELGLDPGPELVALQQAILSGDPSEGAPEPAPRPVRPTTNVPAPVTELVGRDGAVDRAAELLATSRLVTLTGPGGVGKTSVAVTVARSLTEMYSDDVWLVDLTTWDGSGEPAELVLSVLSIADAAGGSEPAAGRLVAALCERRMLLVLDNCEHVIEAVAELVATLLSAAPGLRVLATSREPLRVRGEVRFDLPPLDVPDTDDPARLAQSPAVRLFLARAGLDASPDAVAGAAEVCRRLDGIPLALELAATRVPALGVTELAARLSVPQDRFGLLDTGLRDAPDRQRTLAAVIDWSWQLLGQDERAVLRRLAVHSGGCTLDAAESVCAGDGVSSSDVLNLLAGLVDRSLVVRADGYRGSRFRLLESVAAYCLERLREAGEESTLRRRHADHYLALAEQADPQLRGPAQGEWLRRLDEDAANLRAAFDTYRRGGVAEPALRLAVALTWYWVLRGRLVEGRRSLTEALALPGEAPDSVRVTAEAWRAGLAIRQGQGGPDQAAEVLRGYDKVDDPVGQARAEWFLATATMDFGDQAASRDLLERALATFRTVGDRWGEAAVLSTRAMLAHIRDDLAALEHDARRSAELFAELGDDWGVLQATDWLIGLAELTGDQDEGVRLSREGLRMAEELGLWTEVSGRLAWLSWFLLQTGNYRDAADHAEQALRLATEQRYQSGQIFATLGLAFAARREGELDVAERHLRWLLDAARSQQTGGGNPPYLSMVLTELGMLAGQRGDPAAALDRHREAFDVNRDLRSARGMAWALVGMADAIAVDGRPDTAAQLLGAADTAWREAELAVPAMERDEAARITSAVRAASTEFDVLFARGRELTPDQARSLVDEDRA